MEMVDGGGQIMLAGGGHLVLDGICWAPLMLLCVCLDRSTRRGTTKHDGTRTSEG